MNAADYARIIWTILVAGFCLLPYFLTIPKMSLFGESFSKIIEKTIAHVCLVVGTLGVFFFLIEVFKRFYGHEYEFAKEWVDAFSFLSTWRTAQPYLPYAGIAALIVSGFFLALPAGYRGRWLQVLVGIAFFMGAMLIAQYSYG